ncbi:hypothetical protein GCM10025867_49960 (plasmid) [Frondihabitans sucicola]|uniref:Uncharacterized protein n=2 Tax=Frondihabitans sucicola TaxID=1268041 RepID=A0ABN6Y9Z9_9MICO|nr:hypothetical protein GCM10025867_49960 [Frondihabitans sucicola]
MSELAERILAAQATFDRDNELHRIERSLQYYGDGGASIIEAAPSFERRVAAIDAAIEDAKPVALDTAPFVAATNLAFGLGLTIEHPSASNGRRVRIGDEPHAMFDLFFAADGSFVAMHGHDAHISVRNGDVTAETGLQDALAVLRRVGAEYDARVEAAALARK